MALSGQSNAAAEFAMRPQTFFAEDFSGDTGGFAQGAERALMSALLFDGVQAFLSYASATSKHQRSRYKEAFNWVMRGADDYIFAFDNVCEGLGIDPEFLRAGLINACNSQAFEWKRVRRTS